VPIVFCRKFRDQRESLNRNRNFCRIACCRKFYLCFGFETGSGFQCCGSETFHYGTESYFQKVSVSGPTFFLTKYDFKGPKMEFQNIIFKEYLNLEYKIGQNY
jgi:hypothetical protein